MGYLQRLSERRNLAELKRHIVFGLVVGWMLVIVCGSRYLFAVGANDTVWRAGLYAGFAVLAVTLLVPGILAPAERLLKLVGEVVGKFLFTIVLGTIYYIMFTPVGSFMRCRGSRPFFAWEAGGGATEFEDWVAKGPEGATAAAGGAPGGRNLPLMLQPFLVIGYFIRHGRFLFIPALLLMIVFGLILFFVQTSALAPFIYTLF